MSQTGPELTNREDGTGWWNLSRNGYVTYCGPEKECRKRLAILTRPDTKELQAHNLARAIG